MTETINVLVNLAIRGQNEVKQAVQSVKEINSEVKGAQAKWKEYTFAVGAASAALAGMVVAGKQAWELLKDAAAIDQATRKFGNLAAEINTTGDALLNNLRTATGGMVDDLELMASASELMNQKLASNEDELVRMATVAGQLGWNINLAVREMNNMTGLRLDELGLSIEAVNQRAAELEQRGLSAKEAWKEAILAEGEARVAIVGIDESDPLAQIKELESNWSNFVTSAKTAVLNVVIAGGGLDLLADINRGTQIRDLQRAARDAGMSQYMVGGVDLLSLTAGEMTNAQAAALERIARISSQIDETTWQEFFQPFVDERTAQSVEEMGQRYSALAANFFEATSGERQRGTSWKPIDVESLERSDAELEAIQARLEAMQATAERRAAGGAAFDLGLSDPLQLTAAEDFNQLLYDRALAAGASALALANLGLATGQLTDEQVQNARVSAEFDRQLAAIAFRMANESISYEEYIAAAQEINALAQENNLGGLIQAASGTGYGTVAPQTQAMTEYMNQWREMEGLEVSPTIDVEGGMSEVNSIQSQLEAIDAIEATPEVSIGGSWQSDINAIIAGIAQIEAYGGGPGVPAPAPAPSSSGGGGGNNTRSGGGRDTAVIVNNYVDGYQVPRSSLDDITVDSIKGAMRRVGRT